MVEEDGGRIEFDYFGVRGWYESVWADIRSDETDLI